VIGESSYTKLSPINVNRQGCDLQCLKRAVASVRFAGIDIVALSVQLKVPHQISWIRVIHNPDQVIGVGPELFHEFQYGFY